MFILLQIPRDPTITVSRGGSRKSCDYEVVTSNRVAARKIKCVHIQQKKKYFLLPMEIVKVRILLSALD